MVKFTSKEERKDDKSMITKEIDDLDTYCIYANDFHLEMILLPYIKQNLHKRKFIIITENNMEESVRLLLERINLSDENKEEIYNINWNNNAEDKINYIKSYKGNKQKVTIIIKGSMSFMNGIFDKINSLNVRNYSFVKCYSIEEVSEENLKFNESNILGTKII